MRLQCMWSSPLSQKSLDGSFPFPCPFPCPGPDPGNVLSHDRLRWVFGAPSGTGTGTGTGTNREAFFGLMTLDGPPDTDRDDEADLPLPTPLRPHNRHLDRQRQADIRRGRQGRDPGWVANHSGGLPGEFVGAPRLHPEGVLLPLRCCRQIPEREPADLRIEDLDGSARVE